MYVDSGTQISCKGFKNLYQGKPLQLAVAVGWNGFYLYIGRWLLPFDALFQSWLLAQGFA